MALTTKRIIALPSQTDPQEGDYLAIDNATNGTHKIPVGRIGVEVDDTLTEQGKAADAKAVGDAIDEIRSQIEVTGTASGAIATFTDGADMPAKSVIVTIEPQQSGTGTPSPDNVRPISGWESVSVNVASANLCSDLEQGYWTFADGNAGESGGWIRTPKVRCEPNTSYTVMADERYTRYQGFVYWDSDGQFISSNSNASRRLIGYVATTPSNAKYMAFDIAETNYDSHIQPSDVSRFGIYKTDELATTTTPLGRTVYGGTLDMVTGVLTVDRAMVDLGTLTWTAYGATSAYDRYITSGIDSTVKEGTVGICSHFQGSRSYSAGNIVIGTGAYKLSVFTEKGQYADAAAFKTAMNGVQFCYELATPQTYTLTPTQINTLLGENNVWADAGDVEITYRRDISIVINNLESALNG